MTSIKFIINHKVQYGQAIYLVSSLNDWNIDNNCRMNCCKHCKWEIYLEAPPGNFEYKYVIGNFDNLIMNECIWEDGANRKFQISEQTPKVIKDKWERRKITLSLIKECEKSLAVVLGNKKDLLIPKKMKIGSFYNTKYFYLTIYLQLDELEQDLQVQYYLLIYEQYPIEYVSQPVSMAISELKYSQQRISFQRLPLR